jgi:hypothetical protein
MSSISLDLVPYNTIPGVFFIGKMKDLKKGFWESASNLASSLFGRTKSK